MVFGLLLIPTSILSVYAAALSSRAILRLRTYETATETAAKYNQMAADQLWKTRTTQGAGALAVVLSLGSSIYLRAFSSSVTLTFANAIVSSAAWFHFSPFWHEQVKIPGVTTWNEAVQASNSLRGVLLGLAGTWWTIGILSLVL